MAGWAQGHLSASAPPPGYTSSISGDQSIVPSILVSSGEGAFVANQTSGVQINASVVPGGPVTSGMQHVTGYTALAGRSSPSPESVTQLLRDQTPVVPLLPFFLFIAMLV